MHLLPPPLDHWYTSSFWQVPLHEIAIAAFSGIPLGRANTSSFLFLNVVHWP